MGSSAWAWAWVTSALERRTGTGATAATAATTAATAIDHGVAFAQLATVAAADPELLVEESLTNLAKKAAARKAAENWHGDVGEREREMGAGYIDHRS